MNAVRRIEVPTQSLLGRYVRTGSFVDCYATQVVTSVTHEAFVEAFYTTRLFKVERFLLGAFASRPSTDMQARQLARGERYAFAAWRVEARAANEVLLSAGRTRSWLMVVPALGDSMGTQLLFGSAVLPGRPPAAGSGGLGAVFFALLPFHRVYSRALLLCAKWRVS